VEQIIEVINKAHSKWPADQAYYPYIYDSFADYLLEKLYAAGISYMPVDNQIDYDQAKQLAKWALEK
jgi:hypothetical protein